jgi:hypothetical protein
MPSVIVLSAADAAAVTWIAPSRTAALRPVALSDGRSILGPEVLGDPAHVRSRGRLQALSQVDVATLRDLMPRGTAAR